MKKIDLQMFAEAISGNKLVYLYRIMSKAAEKDAVALAFTTENERSKSKDSDTVVTKDGSIRIPGAAEVEITATSLLAKGDTLVYDLEDAMDNDEIVEIWEANLEEPVGEGGNKFKGMYFQGYLTEITHTSSAEDHVEVELTFAINGEGKRGSVTVSAEQQAAAEYVFTDTAKTGA
jgi:TP901-1 family phage major tail protein